MLALASSAHWLLPCGYNTNNTGQFVLFLKFISTGGRGLCARRHSASVATLHAQLGLGGVLDLLVDEPRLLLGQRSLHVTVDDAVTVAPPPGPGGQNGADHY